MPVDDRPPGVVHHLHPVLLLQLLPVVAEEDLPDGVGAADAIVVEHGQLEIHLAEHR